MPLLEGVATTETKGQSLLLLQETQQGWVVAVGVPPRGLEIEHSGPWKGRLKPNPPSKEPAQQHLVV